MANPGKGGRAAGWPEDSRGARPHDPRPEWAPEVHLTAQVSKVVERALLKCYTPFLLKTVSFGPNQFAYTPGRGARDGVAFYTLSWLDALNKGLKVAVYCSDVSGAFDKVAANRLLLKLCNVRLLISWLRSSNPHRLKTSARSPIIYV